MTKTLIDLDNLADEVYFMPKYEPKKFPLYNIETVEEYDELSNKLNYIYTVIRKSGFGYGSIQLDIHVGSLNDSCVRVGSNISTPMSLSKDFYIQLEALDLKGCIIDLVHGGLFHNGDLYVVVFDFLRVKLDRFPDYDPFLEC